VAGVLLLALLAYKLVFSDRIIPLNYLAYAPSILVGPAAVLLLLLGKGLFWFRATLAALSLTLGAVALSIEQPLLLSRHQPLPVTQSKPFTVMTYNVMAYARNEEEVIATIREERPDILCLVEGTFAERKPPRVVDALGAEYHWAVGSRLSVAARFPIQKSRMVIDWYDLKLLQVDLEGPEGPLSVYAIDLSPPQRRREEKVFQELWATLKLEAQPAVLAGDFNTPRGSARLKDALEGWQDDFRAAGVNSYLGTWPSRPFPLWQLDHSYSRGGVAAIRAEIRRSNGSDHLPLVVEYLQLPSLAEAGEFPATAASQIFLSTQPGVGSTLHNVPTENSRE